MKYPPLFHIDSEIFSKNKLIRLSSPPVLHLPYGLSMMYSPWSQTSIHKPAKHHNYKKLCNTLIKSINVTIDPETNALSPIWDRYTELKLFAELLEQSGRGIQWFKWSATVSKSISIPSYYLSIESLPHALA